MNKPKVNKIKNYGLKVRKKALFELVSEFGVPVGSDNKSNWT